MIRWLGAMAALALLGGCHRHDGGAAAAGGASDGSEIIGTRAPGWDVPEWIGSPPIAWESLRGKVVLVRWFMSTDCPYCTASAPALNSLHEEFGGRGLEVIGMYHHKNPEPLDLEKVRGWVNDFKFRFPVAVDRDWRTLKRWWLDGHDRPYTSVSMLVDQDGVIRHVHPGGTLRLGDGDYLALRSKIQQLLAR
jgi:peroxiredoxin